MKRVRGEAIWDGENFEPGASFVTSAKNCTLRASLSHTSIFHVSLPHSPWPRLARRSVPSSNDGEIAFSNQ